MEFDTLCTATEGFLWNLILYVLQGKAFYGISYIVYCKGGLCMEFGGTSCIAMQVWSVGFGM